MVSEIKLNVKQMALDRVDKILQAKDNKIHLKGNREAYAVIIMISVCAELGYKENSDLVKELKQRRQKLDFLKYRMPKRS